MNRLVGSIVFASVAVLTFGHPCSSQPSPSDTRSIPLNLTDVIVRPGRPYLLSIRTCQPRGITRGVILISNDDEPFTRVRRSHLFTRERDGLVEILPSRVTEVLAEFSSRGGSPPNTRHGPLIAHLLRSSPNLIPGQVFDLEIDPGRTFLIDGEGVPADFEIRNGRMHVVPPDAPFTVALEGFSAEPTGEAVLILSCYEFLRLRHLSVEIQFDPKIFTAFTRTLVWDLRNDQDFLFDDSSPGLLTISLTSPSGSVNLLPGPLVEVFLRVSPFVSPGEIHEIRLNPARCSAISRQGQELQLDLRPALFTIVARKNGGC